MASQSASRGGSPPPAKTFYRRALPCPPATPFSSPEGRTVFREALAEGGMEGYFKLSEQFKTQAEPAFCGLASLAVVLNALAIDPGRPWKGPWRWFSEDMLDCCEPLYKIAEHGVSLDQVACLGRCNGAVVTCHRPPGPTPGSCASDGDSEGDGKSGAPPAKRAKAEGGGVCCSDRTSPPTQGPPATFVDFERDVAAACSGGEGGGHVIVGYTRKAFHQTGDGHFSPVGGYHKGRGLVLILDVARFKYPPHWVPIRDLWGAMQQPDPVTGRPRGYLVLRGGESVPAALVAHRPDEELWRHVSVVVASNLEGLGLKAGGEGRLRRSLADLTLQLRAAPCNLVTVREGGPAAHGACCTTAAGRGADAVDTILDQLEASPVTRLLAEEWPPRIPGNAFDADSDCECQREGGCAARGGRAGRGARSIGHPAHLAALLLASAADPAWLWGASARALGEAPGAVPGALAEDLRQLGRQLAEVAAEAGEDPMATAYRFQLD